MGKKERAQFSYRRINFCGRASGRKNSIKTHASVAGLLRVFYKKILRFDKMRQTRVMIIHEFRLFLLERISFKLELEFPTFSEWKENYF